MTNINGNRVEVRFGNGAVRRGVVEQLESSLLLRVEEKEGPVEFHKPVLISVGLPDGLHQFQAFPYHDTGAEVLFALPAPEESVCLQRREHFRVPVTLPALLHLSTRADPAGTAPAYPIDGRLLDLSAGGACLWVPAALSLEKGAPVEVQLLLKEAPWRIQAVVVRVQEVPGGASHVALSFRGLRPAEQDRLVRFTFAQQFRRR